MIQVIKNLVQYLKDRGGERSTKTNLGAALGGVIGIVGYFFGAEVASHVDTLATIQVPGLLALIGGISASVMGIIGAILPDKK